MKRYYCDQCQREVKGPASLRGLSLPWIDCEHPVLEVCVECLDEEKPKIKEIWDKACKEASAEYTRIHLMKGDPK